MSVFLSPVGNGQQFFLANGLPNNGGLIYTYLAGTTTPATTYTTSIGNVANSNPIVMSAGGTLPNEIWLTGGSAYKFIITDSASVPTQPPLDNISGVNDNSALLAFESTLAGINGAHYVGYKSASAGAIAGTLKDRIYDINAVADFGADPTGLTDSTDALENFFNALFDGCYAIIPPGLYLYTPVIGSAGLLNITSLSGVNLFGYGAVIKNSFSVTTATSVSESLYGIHVLSCTDCNIHGLKFDGNRDTTFGTNGDGNEFYSGFYVTGSTRCKLINCIGVNCQGDGASFNRITGNSGFNNDCGIIGGYYGSNRRNEISVGGDYGWTIDGGVTLFGSSDAHRTNPKAGLDLEWEHATIGPTGNDQRIFVGNVSCSGTMAGGGLYIARGSGITVGDGFRTYGLLGSSINIDSTATGSYETQNINIGACQLNSVYGIGITGGANIAIKGAYIKASYPFTVNSALSSAPYQWVADIDGCTTIGESVFAISVIAGRTKFTNNMCINASSGGSNNFMALFVPFCIVKGNTFTRDTNFSAPGYGLVFGTSGSIFSGNNISSSSISHVVSYGQNSIAAYPVAQNNIYNGASLPDLVATRQFASALVDMSSSVPAVLYTPRGDPSEIAECLVSVAVNGTNIASTTTMVIGTTSTANQYLNTYTLSLWSRGSVIDITGDFASLNTDYSDPVFVTPTPGSNNPKVQFMITTRYNRAGLYTSSVLFG